MNRRDWVVGLGLMIGLSGALRAEECPADKAWFSTAGTPAPSDAEPRRGTDCDFYQRAWQHFLYATQEVDKSPRLLGYETYSQVFGADVRAGLLPQSALKIRVLAPRFVESAQVADAEDIFQAGSSALLIDQNGHAVYYDIILNPVFANFIRNQQLNKLPTLKAAKPTLEIPVGAVEFKAAWQIVDGANPPTDRIVTKAQVPFLIADTAHPGKLKVDATHALRQVTVALLALHVVFRPQGHPEMIWASFEFDGSAPSTDGNPSAVAASGVNAGADCVNPGEPTVSKVLDDGKHYELFANGTPLSLANVKPTAITITDKDMQIFAPKTSIVRTFPFSGCFPGQNQDHAVTMIDGAVTAVNLSAKGQLGDPRRKNYSLVGATWLDEPNNPNTDLAFKEGESFDDFQLGGEDRMSSTSMESFTQVASPNCFACHDTNSKGSLDPKRISVSHVFRRFSMPPPPPSP